MNCSSKLIRILFVAVLVVIWLDSTVRANENRRHVYFGFDGGFTFSPNRDGKLWHEGACFGLAGWYGLSPRWLLGVRAVNFRWILNQYEARNMLIPREATEVWFFTSGTAYIYELALSTRAYPHPKFWRRFRGFVQLDGGVCYLKFDGSADAGYNFNRSNIARYTDSILIDDRAFGGILGIGSGVSFRISNDSRLDVFPICHFVLKGNDVVRYLSAMCCFRVDFGSPWPSSP